MMQAKQTAADVYKLKRPCAKCPFRTDVPPYLHRDRAVEIATSIAEGAMFACHQTTEYNETEDGDGDMVATDSSMFCAGALIVMEKQGADNQHTRIGERLGLYDASKLDLDSPVCGSFVEFIDHHGSDEEDAECCAISNGGCEAPAGYLINGMVVRGETPDYELQHCDGCGETVCDNCLNGKTLCPYCTDDDD